MIGPFSVAEKCVICGGVLLGAEPIVKLTIAAIATSFLTPLALLHAAVAAPTAAEIAAQRAVVDKYCVGCHNAKLRTANLELDKLDLAHLGDHAEIGEKVVRKLQPGMMPPTGMPRPDAATMQVADHAGWKASSIAARSRICLPPGLHRLNRTEYTNAIRDVLGLEVDATKFLPPDDSTRGFDNIAGALTMSPALMEAYLSAAGKISRLAIGDVTAPTQAVFEVPADTAQNYHIEGLPFGTRGGILIKYQFPADGEYTFKVKGVTGYFQAVLGGVKGEQLEVTVDGERVKLFDWDKEIANTTGNGKCDAAHPGQGGPAHGRRDVPRDQRRAGQRAEQAVPAHDEHAGLDSGIPVLSARRPGVDRRTVQRRRAPPTPPAAARFSCAARQQPATKKRLRAHDHFDAREACVPPSGDRGGRRIVDGVLSGGPERRRQLRRRHRSGAAAHPGRSGIRLSRRTGACRWPPARAIASAIWRWRPGCRSSCGAAFPTTS